MAFRHPCLPFHLDPCLPFHLEAHGGAWLLQAAVFFPNRIASSRPCVFSAVSAKLLSSNFCRNWWKETNLSMFFWNPFLRLRSLRMMCFIPKFVKEYLARNDFAEKIVWAQYSLTNLGWKIFGLKHVFLLKWFKTNIWGWIFLLEIISAKIFNKSGVEQTLSERISWENIGKPLDLLCFSRFPP